MPSVKPTRGSIFNINYHLVWCPKYRRSLLVGQVADHLERLFSEIAEQYGFEIFAHEIMPNHVHLFVSAPPKHSPSYLAKIFKGITSRRLRQELGEQIRRKVWNPGTLWSPSYYVGTAGNASADVIRHFIEECQHI